MKTIKLSGFTREAVQRQQAKRQAARGEALQRINALSDALQGAICDYRHECPEPGEGDGMKPGEWSRYDKVTDLLLAIENYQG